MCQQHAAPPHTQLFSSPLTRAMLLPLCFSSCPKSKGSCSNTGVVCWWAVSKSPYQGSQQFFEWYFKFFDHGVWVVRKWMKSRFFKESNGPIIIFKKKKFEMGTVVRTVCSSDWGQKSDGDAKINPDALFSFYTQVVQLSPKLPL